MSRYSCGDDYSYPESDVLKNKFDVKDQKQLDKLEEEFVTLRSFELSEKPFKPPFSVNTIKSIHRKLFGDIYTWAGKFRNVDISKDGTRFANVVFIESSLNDIFCNLVKEKFLKGLNRNDFAKRAAYYMGEINAVHPFREGNGRTQREFINQLAYNANFYITWNKINQKDILEATINSFKSNYLTLEKLISENLKGFSEELPAPKKSIKQIARNNVI